VARDDKATAVGEITEEFRSSTAAVLTEYRGLTVSQLKELRRSLAGIASYAVVKNTLTRRAAADAGVEGLDDLLVGPSAIAFVKEDPVAAAKSLRAFAKDNPALVVKGGYMDGRVLDASEIGKLADLESEVLLAKLAGAMKASMSQAAGLFNAPLSQAARLFAALQDKLPADGAAAPEQSAAEEAPAAEAPAEEVVAEEAAPAEDTSEAPEASTAATSDAPEAPAEGSTEG